MSQKAKIYLVGSVFHCCFNFLTRALQADVHDHMEYILTSMDMFAGIAENLINYTFNVSFYFMLPRRAPQHVYNSGRSNHTR
jgi:hypothetical protein